MRPGSAFLRLAALALCCALPGAAVAAGSVVRLATVEYPPYIQQVAGQAQGLASDLVREAFARMKRPVLIEVYPLNRGLKLLDAGVVDGFFSIKKTPEREVKLIFAREPLFRQDYVFFSRADGHFRFDGNFAAIAGQTIGVLASTSYGRRFDEAVLHGELPRLEVASSYESLFRMLAAGRFDAVICSRLVGIEFVRRIGAQEQIEISGPSVESVPSHLVFAPGDGGAALARSFDSAIAAMKRDGSFVRLTKRYGESPRP